MKVGTILEGKYFPFISFVCNISSNKITFTYISIITNVSNNTHITETQFNDFYNIYTDIFS